MDYDENVVAMVSAAGAGVGGTTPPCGCGNPSCSGVDDPEHACGGPAEACAVAGCPECGAGGRPKGLRVDPEVHVLARATAQRMANALGVTHEVRGPGGVDRFEPASLALTPEQRERLAALRNRAHDAGWNYVETALSHLMSWVYGGNAGPRSLNDALAKARAIMLAEDRGGHDVRASLLREALDLFGAEPSPHAVADLTADEIVDAVGAQFGMDGFRADEMSPLGAPPEAQTLADVREVWNGPANGVTVCEKHARLLCFDCARAEAARIEEPEATEPERADPDAYYARAHSIEAPPPAPRAVADLSDDEIVDAFAACFGAEGFCFDTDSLEPLAERLGVPFEQEDDVIENAQNLSDRLTALEKLGRFRESRLDQMTLIVSPAEWGRRIASKLGRPSAWLAVARLLEGERGDASDTGRPPHAETADSDAPCVHDADHGLHRHRFESNPEEQRFAEAWARQNAIGQTLAYLLQCGDQGGRPREPSAEAGVVAATVIQWLGSPVGQGFLSDLGYRRVKEG